MKPVLKALPLLLVGVSLSGCGYLFGEDGYFRDRGSDYRNSVVEPRMTVPAELNSKPIGDLLPVPGKIEAAVSEGKFKLPRPAALNVGADFSEFSLQQNGSDRWLLAQRTPAELWPHLQQFLNEYSVPVVSESATTGDIETGWLAFDDAANPLVRRLLPAVGPNKRTSGQEQRFRLRIEPGVQSGSSEIKVLHMQRAQGSDNLEWPSVSDNSNLERAVLAELETYLSQSDSGDSASLSTTGLESAAKRATLDKDGAGNPVLNLQTDFNRAWAAVGQALNKADIQVTDINRSAGVYYVNAGERAGEPKKRGFFGRLFGRNKAKQQNTEQRTQVRLTALGSRVQVTVEDSISTSTDSSQAKELLRRIQDNLN